MGRHDEITRKFLVSLEVPMSKQEYRVDVEIFGDTYTLKGDSEPEQMLLLAQYVNRQMKLLAGRNSRLTKAQLAVLAALNIAQELIALKDEHNNLVKMLEPEKKHKK